MTHGECAREHGVDVPGLEGGLMETGMRDQYMPSGAAVVGTVVTATLAVRTETQMGMWNRAAALENGEKVPKEQNLRSNQKFLHT